MIRFQMRAPAHPVAGCAGVLFLFTLPLGGCRERAALDEPVVLELESDTVRLAPGVRLLDVRLRQSVEGEFEPATVAAQPGDVLRFEAADAHSHAVVFEGALLSADALAFLEQTGQLRGPPLLHEGARWIVSLENAPHGDYPFRCITHGAVGRLTVSGARN